MAFTTRMKLEIATELRLPAIRDDHHAMSNAHTSDAVISGNNESMVDKRFNAEVTGLGRNRSNDD